MRPAVRIERFVRIVRTAAPSSRAPSVTSRIVVAVSYEFGEDRRGVRDQNK
jgi:hypothetical protein